MKSHFAKNIIAAVLAALMCVAGISRAIAEDTSSENAYKIGDTLFFGSYEQDNDRTNGKEPIEWIVLDVNDDGSLVLMSRRVLNAKPYNTTQGDVVWAACSLREWLNNTFYNAAFDADEQSRIVTVRLENEDNTRHGRYYDYDTFDKVWLLSIDEATDYCASDKTYAYFTDDASRMCAPTQWALSQFVYQDGSYTVDGVGTCRWWLRTSGYFNDCAAYVDFDGSVNEFGDITYSIMTGVRPVVCILPY